MESRQSKCAQGEQVGNDAALHIASAATIEAPLGNVPTQRFMAPGRRIADFDRVDMAVQNQGTATAPTPKGSNDVWTPGEIGTESNGLRVLLQLRKVRLPYVNIEVMGAHQPSHRVLGWPFITGLAWNPHQLLVGRHDFRSQCLDCLRDHLIAVSSLRHSTHAAEIPDATPGRLAIGVKDSSTRSRRMPSPSQESQSSR